LISTWAVAGANILPATLTSLEIDRVLKHVPAVATPVKPAFPWRPRLRDPNDDMVLETTVNGNAGAIVTFNQRDFEEAQRSLLGAQRYRRRRRFSKSGGVHETKKFCIAVTVIPDGRSAQTGRIRRGGSESAHQCRRGRENLHSAHRAIFPGA